MGRRHVVKELTDEQFAFVIDCIIGNLTDREISAEFQHKFNAPLSKSSLQRWRVSAGNELAERYRLARYQAKQLMVDLEGEDKDSYQVVIRNIEDRLLSATREVIAQNPVKLLQIKQEELRRQLKERELDLKQDQLELDREKHHGAAIDRVKLGEEFSGDLLEYLESDPDGLRFFSKHVKLFNDFLVAKYGEK